MKEFRKDQYKFSFHYKIKKCTTSSLIIIISLFVLIAGCIDISGAHESDPTTDDGIIIKESVIVDTVNPVIIEEMYTPDPTPTPIISTITDWNPYEVLPLPEQIGNRTSILRNDDSNTRKILNTTYSASVGLGGYANGKILNITKGPFAISYTVHPNVTNPLLVWAKITVSDPWQQVIAEDGYNRGYSSEETKTITVYREGIHYLTIEGEFATIDYSIKTGDPAPEITPAPAPEYYEDEWFEGEGPY
ncbi:MAG: hypothetical protein BWY45_02533 [Euryarchaeota archaeon ADurb.Bin294]|jgi:hypothetical protein|nr:MAG: hypothetical protein BWY45_02533 [Euryarchaeota archaeon ADurb.Bin294]